MKRLTDPSFVYTPAIRTDIRKTFARARAATEQESEPVKLTVLRLIYLLTKAMNNHASPDNPFYNECDQIPCQWCEDTRKAIAVARAAIRSEA